MAKFSLEGDSAQRKSLALYAFNAVCLLALAATFLPSHSRLQRDKGALHACQCQGQQRDEWGLLPLPKSILEDFAVATWSSAPRHGVVKAMRPFRRGVRTVIFTNATADEVEKEQAEGARYNEQWVQLLSESNTPHNAITHPFLFWSRGAQAAVRPIEVLGPTFKWLVFGDDDVLFFWPGILRAIKGLRHTDPYYLCDSYYGQRNATLIRAAAAAKRQAGKRRRLNHATQQPRCVPCTVDMTDEELFSRMAVKTCNCTVDVMKRAFGWVLTKELNWDQEMDWRIHAPIWCFDGGAGSLISLEYLQRVNRTRFYECTTAPYGDLELGPHHQSGSDSLTTGCFWREGLGYTDPGWSLDRKEWQVFDMVRSDWFKMRHLLSSALEGTCTADEDNCTAIVRNAVSLHGGGGWWGRNGELVKGMQTFAAINRLAALYAELHDPLEALLPPAR